MMQISRIINAPTERVWELLVDTRHWSRWGPSVKAVDCDPHRLSVGLQGRVKTVIGIWVPFTITRCENLRYWDWRVAGASVTGHRLETLDSARCRLIFSLPAVLFPYVLVCRRALENIASLAEAAESSVETLPSRSVS